MSLAGIAKETVAIVEAGRYQAPSGREVSIRSEVEAAISGTLLYRPTDFAEIWEAVVARPRTAIEPHFEVSPETTAAAARRLTAGGTRILALNFASAKNPGGGFLGGAKAQEEDLARCSALYACQVTQRAYYDQNRTEPSLLYTDHMIYSPGVPFFRDEKLELLEAPFVVSLITAPAPNAGEALRRDPSATPEVNRTLRARALKLLAIAAHRGYRQLVLGAWGCGVFRNDPREVAAAFAESLADPRLSGAFERVVFAVYDRRPGGANFAAFAERFGAPRS